MLRVMRAAPPSLSGDDALGAHLLDGLLYQTHRGDGVGRPAVRAVLLGQPLLDRGAADDDRRGRIPALTSSTRSLSNGMVLDSRAEAAMISACVSRCLSMKAWSGTSIPRS